MYIAVIFCENSYLYVYIVVTIFLLKDLASAKNDYN